MKAKIKSKKEVAKQTLEVVYDLLGEKADFKAGQYFYITLPNGLRHHFTILNSPNDNGILSHTTRLRDTDFKNTLKDLEEGTEVEVGDIGGKFLLPDEVSKPLVFIALGIGITPYVSMARYIREEGKDFAMTLIYSDSNKESMPYLEEFEKLANKNPNFDIILTITKDEAWEGEKRRVGVEFLKDYFPNPENLTFYISGPPAAVEGVSKSLKDAGIAEEDIMTENFSGY